MNLIPLIIIATVAYAFFQFFSAKAGGKIDGGLVPVIVNAVSIVVPLLFLLTRAASKAHFLPTKSAGLFYAALAGLSIATFALAFSKIFQHGGNLSYVSPLIFGGAIVLSTVLSLLFLKESLTTYHILGIVLVVSGIAVIALARATSG